MQLVQKPAGYIAGGSIEYKGKEIASLGEAEMRKIRGKEISMIFQEPMTSLNPVFTIGNQIEEVILQHQNLTPSQARKKAIEMLGKVGIPDPDERINDYPFQLSGGMRQRVMIAIALSCRPGLLIADEPTTALDVTIQVQILDLMKNLQNEFGTAILLITHNLGLVAENAHQIAVMYAGKVVERAPRDKFFANPSHPYTVRLLQSLPGRQKRNELLQTIDGRVPAATQFPDGCRFAPRCHKAVQVCSQKEPALLNIDHDHHVACILYDRELMGRTVSSAEVREQSAPRPKTEGEKSDKMLIGVKGLQVHFPIKKGLFKRTVNHVRAVDGVDLEIPRGKTIALVGESGCGKTTLGKAILQLIKPTAGSILYDGKDLTKLSRSQLKPYRQRLQIVFQDPFSSLNPRMMIRDILQEGMKTHHVHRNGLDARCHELMERVGLDPKMIYRYPHEFSGGQRQRIGIARALAVNPDFIVCDEATSSLDVSVQAQIINILEKLQTEFKFTILLITHDLSVVEYIADEVAVMYLGRIVEQAPTEELFDDPKHPYTRALLAAVPKIDPATGLKKIKLSGDVPSPARPPSGCHFHPRCPQVMPHCSKEYPPEFKMNPTHTCRCYLYGQ
jgi:peptide/nickel transport system ATP-binding protein